MRKPAGFLCVLEFLSSNLSSLVSQKDLLMTREVVFVGAARTAIGSFGGSLRDVPPADLGALVIKTALERAGVQPRTSATWSWVT